MRRCKHSHFNRKWAQSNQPHDVQDAIRGLKVGNTWDPDVIPNRALKHPPLSVFSFVVVLFNAISRRQYFPATWKTHAFSIIKPRKDPAMPSSYRTINLRHDWQIDRKKPALQNFLRSQRTRITVQWAVSVQTQTRHQSIACPPCGKNIQKLWREETNLCSIPGSD